MRRLAQRIGLGLVLMGTTGTASAQLPTPHGVWGGNPLRPAGRLPSVVPAQFSEDVPFSTPTPTPTPYPSAPADPSELMAAGLGTPGLGTPDLAPGAGRPGPLLPPADSEMEPVPTTPGPVPGGLGAEGGSAPPGGRWPLVPEPSAEATQSPEMGYSSDNPLGFGDSGQMWDGPAPGDGTGPGVLSATPMGIQPVWEGAMGDQMVLDGPARLFSTREWFRSGRWYSAADFVLLTMVSSRNVPVAVDTTSAFSRAIDPLTGQSLINTSNINGLTAVQSQLGTESARFNFQPGLHLKLGRYLGRDEMNRDHAIEVDYFGMFNYASQATLTASVPDLLADTPGVVTMLGNGINQIFTFSTSNPAGGLGLGGAATGFVNGRTATIYNAATLNNGEVNWQVMARPRRDRLVLQPDGEWVQHSSPSQTRAFLAGFRYVQLDESFAYDQFGANGQLNHAQYTVDVTNDLFGLQLGGRLQEVYSNWQWDLETKIGGLWNFAGRDSLVSTLANGTLTSRSQSVTDEQLGIVLQLGVGGAYRITPNFAVTTVYNLVYLNNVATSIDNLSLAPAFPLFDLSGDRLFHGLSSGVQLTW